MNDAPLSGLSLRQPPADLRAEQGLLGALLANNKAYEGIGAFLKPEHFADLSHGRIYDAIAKRIEGGGLADGITMMAHFRGAPVLDSVGGEGYIAQLLASMVGIKNASAYAQVIVEMWARRQIIEFAEGAAGAAFSAASLAETVESASSAIQRIAEATSAAFGATSTKSIGDAVEAALAEADAVAQGKLASGTITGMRAIDEAIGVMEDGHLIVLAGRPGGGKSSLAWQWVINAGRRGEGVLAISMEMSAAALGRRALSVLSGVPVTVMRRGHHAVVVERLIAARKELLHLPVSIEDGDRLINHPCRDVGTAFFPLR